MLTSPPKQLLMSMCAMLAIAVCAPAQAAPPTFTRGIDLANVLLMREHATSQDWTRKRTRRRRGKRLKHLKVIVIDPGHGGENQGALGVASVHEKFLTMDLAYRLRDRLKRAYPKSRIIMTRYWDRSMSLSDRIHLANKIEADLFISLHYNSAMHGKANGIETFFLTTAQATPGKQLRKGKPLASAAPNTTGIIPVDTTQNVQGTAGDALATLKRDLQRMRQHRESGLLAEAVQRRLTIYTKARDRGVKQANFGVLRGALMPAIVVEGGFVSHPEEGKQIMEAKHRDALVRGLVRAVHDFDRVLSRRKRK